MYLNVIQDFMAYYPLCRNKLTLGWK